MLGDAKQCHGYAAHRQQGLSEDGVATARESDAIRRKGNAKHGDGYAQLCYVSVGIAGYGVAQLRCALAW